MCAVVQGNRPLRPSDDRCLVRGLNDEIWNIIETCWAQEPDQRLSTGRIVERLNKVVICPHPTMNSIQHLHAARCIHRRSIHSQLLWISWMSAER